MNLLNAGCFFIRMSRRFSFSRIFNIKETIKISVFALAVSVKHPSVSTTSVRSTADMHKKIADSTDSKRVRLKLLIVSAYDYIITLHPLLRSRVCKAVDFYVYKNRSFLQKDKTNTTGNWPLIEIHKLTVC